jgi:peptide/nickel transport system permease protein
MNNQKNQRKSKSKTGRLSFLLLLIYSAVVLVAFIYPYLQESTPAGQFALPTPAEKAPSFRHPFGLDNLGNDVLGNVLSGFKTSFVSGILATFLFLICGLAMGIFMGYEDRFMAGIFGGIANSLNSIPKFFALFLAFIIIGKYRPFILMTILGILSAPRLAEILRFKISHYRKEDFYDAAIALGLSPMNVVCRHIIWYNTRKAIFSELAYMFGYAILSEATLSFILLGSAGEGWKSWGAIINEELNSFSVLIHDVFNPSAGGLAADNPLKFLTPFIALVLTVMLFTILSRKFSEEV